VFGIGSAGERERERGGVQMLNVCDMHTAQTAALGEAHRSPQSVLYQYRLSSTVYFSLKDSECYSSVFLR